MDEQHKHAILFTATILAARKLNDIGSTPARECGIVDAIEKAHRILENIDERWPTNKAHGTMNQSSLDSSAPARTVASLHKDEFGQQIHWKRPYFAFVEVKGVRTP